MGIGTKKKLTSGDRRSLKTSSTCCKRIYWEPGASIGSAIKKIPPLRRNIRQRANHDFTVDYSRLCFSSDSRFIRAIVSPAEIKFDGNPGNSGADAGRGDRQVSSFSRSAKAQINSLPVAGSGHACAV